MKKLMISISSLIILSTISPAHLLADTDFSQIYPSEGSVEFYPNTDITPPVDPEKPDPGNPVNPWDPTTPDGKPEPGTQGPLSIDFASSIDFGSNEISNQDKTYYANPQYLFNQEGTDKDETTARPNYVQITDSRGNKAGWSLHVTQKGQFTNESAKYKELYGARISFTNGEADSNVSDKNETPSTFDMVLTPNETALVMAATEGQGTGTWVDRWGTLALMEIEGKKVLKNPEIFLEVPGKTPKDAVQYKTKFIWTLTDVPFYEE